MIARLKCLIFGHKRGKFIQEDAGADGTHRGFRCPRCKATWTRKVKAA